VFYNIIIVILINLCAFVVLNCNNCILMHGMENVKLEGENGTFDSVLYLKCFIQALKFWAAHLKFTVNPQSFHPYSVAP
jgi:hypothetical protein